MLFQSRIADGACAASASAYIDTAPITSTSQALGVSFSPIMLIVRQVAQPKLSCRLRQHWIALASQSLSSIQRSTAIVHLAWRRIFSGLMCAGDAAVGGDLGELGLHLRRVVAHRMGGADDLGEVDGDHRQTRGLQQLLAEPHRLEGAGARADRTDPRVLQAAHDAADAHEAVEIGGEFLAVDVAGVAGRVGERDAVLVEIVGDRELAAEGVAAAGDVDLVDLVIARLKQDRHVELRLADELHDRDFVAEVRQADDQAVDRVALLAKMRGVEAAVVARLHRAVLCRFDRQDAVADAELFELGDELSARFDRRRAVEELAAADNQPQP